jgi:hypothetical protein
MKKISIIIVTIKAENFLNLNELFESKHKGSLDVMS